jgi:hypothetical protein
MSYLLDQARAFAKAHGWAEICHQENILMVSFQRGTARLNVYYSKGTVGTVVDHPRWGRNQMFRRNVHGENLSAVFDNPRAHLNQEGIPGYHQNGRHISNTSRRKS